MKWNIFLFFRGNGCLIVAASASSTSGDNDVERGCRLRLILRGMGNEWIPFEVDMGPEDRVFVINWDHNCFMVDVNGIEVFSRSPSGPVVADVKVSLLNKGSEEVELIVVGMHADEDDSVIGAQGEDGGGGES